MEGHLDDLEDWEILSVKNSAEDGIIEFDNCILDSEEKGQEGAAWFEFADDEGSKLEDSDNPVSVDPQSNSHFSDHLGRSCSGDSLNNRRSRFVIPKDEHEITNRDEEEEAVVPEGTGEIEGRMAGFAVTDEEDSGVHTSAQDASCDSSVKMDDEKKGVLWWKLPFELLPFSKVKPAWPISIAAAVLGFWMLRKTVYRKKQKIQIAPLITSLDEKLQKAPQLNIQAGRLNEAFFIARRVVVTRSSQSAGNLIPLPVVDIH
ncbi:uncharacterized protein LOC121984442 isoform X1 [Zingiber officinale]|uniref:uncharacterized protein LOC121984442 isoform X1 n=1 Tax=Zingiber officinale TaxID=94328 RepID=UPI001C4B674B|nr:uncharacterized protein LOC121984442 isoform X1 [Zingiber officinale]